LKELSVDHEKQVTVYVFLLLQQPDDAGKHLNSRGCYSYSMLVRLYGKFSQASVLLSITSAKGWKNSVFGFF